MVVGTTDLKSWRRWPRSDTLGKDMGPKTYPFPTSSVIILGSDKELRTIFDDWRTFLKRKQPVDKTDWANSSSSRSPSTTGSDSTFSASAAPEMSSRPNSIGRTHSHLGT